jgi:hypothetical protein
MPAGGLKKPLRINMMKSSPEPHRRYACSLGSRCGDQIAGQPALITGKRSPATASSTEWVTKKLFAGQGFVASRSDKVPNETSNKRDNGETGATTRTAIRERIDRPAPVFSRRRKCAAALPAASVGIWDPHPR